jgi:hypothetical protein
MCEYVSVRVYADGESNVCVCVCVCVGVCARVCVCMQTERRSEQGAQGVGQHGKHYQ